jgi:redox-sensing transcriptional repressor
MHERTRIPKPAARRLSLYLRTVQDRLEQEGASDRVSSRELGEAAGVADAQVRKDLASFGAGGQPGVGYRIRDLHEGLRRALGLQQPWRAVLVGAGNIGRALLAYPRFAQEGFEIVAVLDRDGGVVGRKIAGHAVQSMNQLSEVVRRSGAQLGVIAVPPDEAQAVGEMLVSAGIRGILNFAPRSLRLTRPVPVVGVDFTEALERLAFEVTAIRPASGRGRSGG